MWSNTLISIFVSFVYKATHNKPKQEQRKKTNTLGSSRLEESLLYLKIKWFYHQTTYKHAAWLSSVTFLKRGCFCTPKMPPAVSTVSSLTVVPLCTWKKKKKSSLNSKNFQQTNWWSFQKKKTNSLQMLNEIIWYQAKAGTTETWQYLISRCM